jgi:hypothetical protein
VADADQFYVKHLEKRFLAMQSERDELLVVAASLKAELWQRDIHSEGQRKRIRAAAAKQSRHHKRETKPQRGEFHLDCYHAVPIRISQLGAVEDEVLSTLTVSREKKWRSSSDADKPARRKKESLLNLRTTINFKPSNGRKNRLGKEIGWTEYSMHTILNGFVRFSSPGNSSLARLGANPALAALGSNIMVQPEGLSGYITRRDLPPGNKPINATGATTEQTLSRQIRTVQLAIDKMMVDTKMIEKVDVVHMQVDSSTFGDHCLQAAMLTLLTIVWESMDALGTPLYHIIKISKSLESLPCSDHKTVDQVIVGTQKKAGGKKSYRKEASFNLGAVFIMP